MHNPSAYKSDVNFGTMTGTKTFLLLWILVVRVNIHDKMGLISDPLQWNSHGFFFYPAPVASLTTQKEEAYVEVGIKGKVW